MSQEILGLMGKDEVSFKYIELQFIVRHLCMKTTNLQVGEIVELDHFRVELKL